MQSKLEIKLAEFRRVFSLEFQTKLGSLIALWQASRTSQDKIDINKFHFEIHSLKGSSGALNFLKLSHQLGLIEDQIVDYQNQNTPFTEILSTIDLHMNVLIESTKREPNPFLHIPSNQATTLKSNQVAPADSQNTISLHSYRDISIAMIDADQTAGELMNTLLGNFGFDFSYFSTIEAFKKAQTHTLFKLVLLDAEQPNVAPSDIFKFAQQLQNTQTEIFILSSDNQFESRLNAVRARVTDYILKPINITVLVSKIRKAFKIDLIRPYRILLLDDQVAIGGFYKTLLESQGADVIVLSNAKDIMTTLESFHPDIFLFDMFMPNISGLEVSKLIRQQAKYDFIPIVFLTGAADIETKINALEAGADDVIPKNTAANLFIKQIDYRIQRYQQIRYIASRDSLTGVLNHGQIMDAATQTFALAARHVKPMVMVMIDLDNFKKVNDTYGHIGGDKVLVSLGQLLQQSIRETDFVGRYGGEEFMLVFSDADSQVIAQKMTTILNAFHSIDFDIDGETFKCSFSAGLASSANYDKLDKLIAAADIALYQAKAAGKNQIALDE